MTLVLMIIGLVLLIAGAGLLVRGAAQLAYSAGVTPLVTGLTIVAYGTSAPELVVSVGASHSGESAIALGNVVGSNIFNVLFILGLSALITPLAVSRQLIRLDMPLMIGVSVLALLLCLDGSFGLLDGLICLTGLAAYTILVIHQGRTASPGQEGAPSPHTGGGG